MSIENMLGFTRASDSDFIPAMKRSVEKTEEGYEIKFTVLEKSALNEEGIVMKMAQSIQDVKDSIEIPEDAKIKVVIESENEMAKKKTEEQLERVISYIEAKEQTPWWKKKLTEITIGVLIVVISGAISFSIFNRIDDLDREVESLNDKVFELGMIIGYSANGNTFTNEEDSILETLTNINKNLETLLGE